MHASAIGLVEMGADNVFADLGLSDPDDRRLRTQLAAHLNDLLMVDGMTQAAVAKRLLISKALVSELKNYRLSRISCEKLLHFITLMDRDVEIFILPRAAGGVTASLASAVTVWAAA